MYLIVAESGSLSVRHTLIKSWLRRRILFAPIDHFDVSIIIGRSGQIPQETK
jgi:hypothetical protein